MPMKGELTERGFSDLVTDEAVDNTIAENGTALVVINSVCGCSAGTARPGVLMADETSLKQPDRITTVLSSFDTEAVNTGLEHLLPYPPSSPSIALFKDGKLVHFVERHNIEGRSAQMIANNLKAAFEEFC